MNKPLVSILCVTYNHAQFIRSCLKSLVGQKCNFNFEILIHDDASTDNTQAIIKEFQQDYPHLIKPILQTENQWSKKEGSINLRFNYPRAQGKYLALCDGDDFWIGSDKLQKQVEILEKYPECSITSGAYLMICKGKEDVEYQNKNQSGAQDTKNDFFFELEDVSNNFFIKPSTILFRNMPHLLQQLQKYEFCVDMHVFYLLLKAGKGYYSREVMAGYNKHPGGVYSGSSSQEILLTQYVILKDIYDKDGDEYIRKKYLELAFLMINLKISGLMPAKKISQKTIRNRNPGAFKIMKEVKPILQNKVEHQVFYKSLIPMQVKVIRQKLKSVLSFK